MLRHRFALSLVFVFLLPLLAFAKPKTKVFNDTPDEVFQAALKTATERHVVTFIDAKDRMFTFETGASALSYGFIANASVEPEGSNRAKLIINVQHKNAGKNVSFSFNAGDRMANKFFKQVQQELAKQSSEPAAQKPGAPHVAVLQTASEPQSEASQTGTVSVVSNPAGCDVSVDGAFVGDAPAVLNLTPGKHTVSVTKSGYQPWSRNLTVMNGSHVNLNATLTK